MNPLDAEYFQFIHDLASNYGTIKVYNSFKRLYAIAELEMLAMLLKL